MKELNEKQLAVVNSTANKILCLAGAGAGKTHTMIERISKLVSDGVNPESILVLTFTNAAAAEMKCRYLAKYESDKTPEFRTFHSFCYNLICSDAEVRHAIGYVDVPSIIQDVTYKKFQTQIKTELHIKLSDEIINGKKQPSITEKPQLDLFNKRLKKLLIQSSLITFDILCYDICGLFKSHNPVIFPYTVKYKYIFVDEFQDTDPKQWEFVSSFENAKLFITGDSSQALYAFRGADSSIIKSLADSDEWTTYKLNYNYRSTKQICKFANDISREYGSERYHIEMVSNRNGEDVNVEYLPTDYDTEYMDVIELLPELTGTTAILARTNKEVHNIQRWLEESNIEYATNSSDTYTEYILKSVMDDEFRADFLSSLLDADQYVSYMRDISVQHPADKVEFLLNNYKTSYIKYMNDTINSVDIYLNVHLTKNTSMAVISNCCTWVIKKFYPQYNDIPEILSPTKYGVLDAAWEVLSHINKAQNSIYVGTIHSVKGLEYDNVIVTGVESDAFKITNEDMNNLYYVACTRAKNRLFVFEYMRDFKEF